MSSGAPIRRTGIAAATRSRSAARSAASSPLHISLSVYPGRIALTRTGPSSSASARVRPSTPANAATTVAASPGGRTTAAPVT